jgi:NADH-quinone oxidoreductase subunit B
MGLEHKLGDLGIVTTTLEEAVNWGRTRSMWPALFGLACCAIEMMAAQASHYDMSRFGMELMRASPRQSDLMIVAGRVSRKMAPVVRRLYDQMPEPKWVITMGDCPVMQAPFEKTYAIRAPAKEHLPITHHIPGCPPSPEKIIEGLLEFLEKI